jgi:hypothetical protein
MAEARAWTKPGRALWPAFETPHQYKDNGVPKGPAYYQVCLVFPDGGGTAEDLKQAAIVEVNEKFPNGVGDAKVRKFRKDAPTDTVGGGHGYITFKSPVNEQYPVQYQDNEGRPIHPSEINPGDYIIVEYACRAQYAPGGKELINVSFWMNKVRLAFSVPPEQRFTTVAAVNQDDVQAQLAAEIAASQAATAASPVTAPVTQAPSEQAAPAQSAPAQSADVFGGGSDEVPF